MNPHHADLVVWRDPRTDVRILVESWSQIAELRGKYVIPPKNFWVLWNYVRRIGFVQVVRKVLSRLAERRRNVKVAIIGVGRVVEAPAEETLQPGERVVFIAPAVGPPGATLCVNSRFVRHIDVLRHISIPADGATKHALLSTLAGWDSYSGVEVSAAAVEEALAACAPHFEELAAIDRTGRGAGLPTRCTTERINRERRSRGLPSAVLFGLGNYAKTQIIPNIRGDLDLKCIHEIDPCQLGYADRLDVSIDTSPWPRPTEAYDAWFIAGYHHTHAALAAHALRTGAYAVVEKPLVTTLEQYEEVDKAIGEAGTERLFVCFHKRYSRLHAFATNDLQIAGGTPVDMHCIVYEIPLPPLHWYNWPNSGSRIVSNGCHWLDYFMYVNDYSPAQSFTVERLRGRDLAVIVRLANDAILVMSLTEVGSDRLGVRDVIELRHGKRTVRMIDGARYESESSRRVIRRARVNPLDAYKNMYRAISGRIRAGEAADPLVSLRSTQLMLAIDAELAG
jgi:predicted dehydrogenase